MYLLFNSDTMTLKKLFAYEQPLVAGATILSIALIICVLYAGNTAYKIKMSGDVLEITGSAKMAVDSDYARWTLNLETKTGINDQQAGFDRLEAAKDKIVKYLEEKAFKDVETPVASVNPDYLYPQNATAILTGYTVTRSIVIRSENIAELSTLANNISPLTGPQYTVTTGNLELTYQKLDKTRVDLLTKAIADAKARAKAIAKETGREVGQLKTATGGVVQVLPQGGVEVSDYGSYDTQSQKKDVMVTVRATFSLK